MNDPIDSVPKISPPSIPAHLPGEMWGVTTCFNPAGYDNKYDHLQRFAAAIRGQGLKLLVVELALCGQPFRLKDDVADRVIRLTSDTILWHKERLLNIAIQALPPECDKVAWVDADLLFENSDWIAQTAGLLEQYMLVQTFQYYCPLPRSMHEPPPPSEPLASVPSLVHARQTGDETYAATALPGGAWAARRSLLEKHGIYDRFVLGGGDAAVGWAMYGLTDQWLNQGWFRLLLSTPLADDLRAWSAGLSADVQGSVAFTPGRIFHLWHGDAKQRRYVLRFMTLRDTGFDPGLDIATDAQQCWRWNSDKPELHRKVEEYFRSRKEEG
jgi:hypothetical protein